MSSAPVYASAALGYRTWYVCDGQLASTGKGATVWRPGVNLMSCQYHVQPRAECSCGLYAFHDLEMAKECNRLLKKQTHPLHYRCLPIVGAVAFRGQVQSHHHGLRGEEACILALALTSADDQQEAEAQQIADRYSVPLLHLDELKSFASQYALEVPEEQRGADPTPPPHIPDGRFPWRPLARILASVGLTCLFWSLLLVLLITKQQAWHDMDGDSRMAFSTLISAAVILTSLVAADKDLSEFSRRVREWRLARHD